MGRELKDEELLRRNAYVGEELVGTVHDLYLSPKGGRVIGLIVAVSPWKSKPVKRGQFAFDGKRYTIHPESSARGWKPAKGSAVKYSKLRDKEVFAGPGWKIGRLDHLYIDTEEWVVTSLDVMVEHGLILRDVGEYRRLREDTAPYGFIHTYKNIYSFKPGKIVEEMGDSEKARFLSDSGDSSIRGLGEAISKVNLPSQGMRIQESATIVLLIDAHRLQEVAIEMINRGELKVENGRRNILRNIFAEYYRRKVAAEEVSGDQG